MKNLIVFAMVAVSLIIFYGCQKEEIIIDQSEVIPQNDFTFKEGQIKLGEKLENPYSVENMHRAYNNIKDKLKSAIDIDTTHYYVRFLPKTDKKLMELLQDTTLEFYDYPLDVEMEQGGTYYHDPSIPVGKPTWQYTVVPVDYSFPEIEFEKLASLYLQNEDDDGNLKSNTDAYLDWAKLENEALRITNNLDENQSGETEKGSRWYPSGVIQAEDDLLNRLIPIEGVKVRANRWFTTKTGYTNSSGYFQTGSFKRPVNYSIKWERGYYDIRNGSLLQAYYNGPKQTGSWDLDIYGGESIMYATMHRAAHKHFYGDNLGIFSPVLPGSKTKICYIDKFGTGVFWGDWSATGILPDIKIWGKDANNNYHNTNTIFGFTAHELGHQSHSLYMGNIQFWQTTKVIYESWATAVEWALTNDEYHKLGAQYNIHAAINYNHEAGHHWWPVISNDVAYSPIFIDLIDDENQRDFHGSTDYPNDVITGYTLQYINQNILHDSYGISSLTNALKAHKITGISDEDIDKLTELY